MKKYKSLLLTSAITISVFLLLSCARQTPAIITSSPSTNPEIQAKVEALMATMTLEDKVGEMTQLAIDAISVGQPYNLEEPHRLDTAKMRRVLVDLKVGSILNVGGHAYTRQHWEEIIKAIQDMAINEKESGIPVLYGIDAIHGANYTQLSTLFPQQLAQASTWNPEIAFKTGEITSYETRASGIPWNFAPVLDIGRDPRWARIWETYGEDVFLASQMGSAFVRGSQGTDISAQDKVATCMKHFLGYSVTARGKDRTQAWIPERQLKEYFVPTFQAAVDAGAKTVMICSGEINGIPVHCNPDILKDLLRDEMGFKGLAVTDWEDISYLYTRHRVAKDFKEAIMLAINAGIDMAMVPMDTRFPVLLKELVEENKVPLSRIDEAVERIVTLKFELGLFEDPYFSFDNYQKFGSEEFQNEAFQASEESIILVENSGILPLDEDVSLLVTGPTANIMNPLNGGWSRTWQGSDPRFDDPDSKTLLDAFRDQWGEQKVIYSDAGNDNQNLAQTIGLAGEADVIVACIGEFSYTEKPGDIDNLALDRDQIDLVNALYETGKPVILLITEGRPRVIREIADRAAAILLSFIPGEEGGPAFASVMAGMTNPSGKLPITYPRFVNDLVNYDHKGTDLVHRDFSMRGFNPQWEFGHGLSYTEFEYSDLKTDRTEISMGDAIEVSVTVKNTGDRSGKEVVQVYVSDLVASITPSVKRLRAFQKIELSPNQTKTVRFKISTDQLAFVGLDNEWTTEPGEFEIIIAGLTKRFSVL